MQRWFDLLCTLAICIIRTLFMSTHFLLYLKLISHFSIHIYLEDIVRLLLIQWEHYQSQQGFLFPAPSIEKRKKIGLEPNIRMNLILGILSNSYKPYLILISRILDKNIRQNILPITLSALL